MSSHVVDAEHTVKRAKQCADPKQACCPPAGWTPLAPVSFLRHSTDWDRAWEAAGARFHGSPLPGHRDHGGDRMLVKQLGRVTHRNSLWVWVGVEATEAAECEVFRQFYHVGRGNGIVR